MASFHPPRFDSRCSRIQFRWLERSLRQQIKQTFTKKNNHMHFAVAQHFSDETQCSASQGEEVV